MLRYHDFIHAFREIGLTGKNRVIIHASMNTLGEIAGGIDTILGALLANCETLITPTFTSRPMIVPQTGPPNNALSYGEYDKQNQLAEFFHPDMPVDPEMGPFAEAFYKHPDAHRTTHPLLSLAGINADDALAMQSLETPFAPIRWLADSDGDVLLLGDTHVSNISLHYAEKLAGRKQFIRWALTPRGAVVCPSYPGCSLGFPAIETHLSGVARHAQLNTSIIELIPLRDLIHITVGRLRAAPEAMLCNRPGCPYCDAVRSTLS